MKKLIILSIMLCGCSDTVVTKFDSTRNARKSTPYIIDYIEQEWDVKGSKYSARLGVSGAWRQGTVYFIDSVGKYNIGDTVYAEFIK